MKTLATAVGLRLGLAIVAATMIFSVAYADESAGLYSCCGNTSAPNVDRCRYTDRDVDCTYDSTCASNTGHTMCCTDKCFKYPYIE